MHEKTLRPNGFLKQSVRLFYHTRYTGKGNPRNPGYLNDLKNDR
ncbi:MAG: hypothetical protein KatS3mg111_1718 [Pirellulaceae bacterium]|nr:MAG: hypothetical protein KatS3mg111_1718 [Pirellulaceae bacterium]